MMIQITDPQTKAVIGVDAGSIFFVLRAADNPLVTLVMTNVMTKDGPMQFQAMESPEEIIAAVNGAMADVPLGVRPAGVVLAS